MKYVRRNPCSTQGRALSPSVRFHRRRRSEPSGPEVVRQCCQSAGAWRHWAAALGIAGTGAGAPETFAGAVGIDPISERGPEGGEGCVCPFSRSLVWSPLVLGGKCRPGGTALRHGGGMGRRSTAGCASPGPAPRFTLPGQWEGLVPDDGRPRKEALAVQVERRSLEVYKVAAAGGVR